MNQDSSSGPSSTPDIDYLSRDFASFRQLMLSRIASLSPDAATGHPADLGTVLIELLASAADELSLYQDAVVTESYLATARLRTSVRRHARLLDYAMHDGCSARVWITVMVTPSADGKVLPQGTPLLTRVEGQAAVLKMDEVFALRSRGALVFETAHDLLLQSSHNRMRLDPSAGALSAGAQAAVLLDAASVLMLRAGDVLIFEDASEQAGTAVALQRRQAVRITSVEVAQNASAQRVVRVRWGSADALTFSLSAERAQVVGNVVLADHGYTLPEKEALQAVTPGTRPQLQQGPLTWQAMVLADGQPVLFDQSQAAATAIPSALSPDTLLRPVIVLQDGSGQTWQARQDLLSSLPQAREFVVESEEDGRAFLRFGDGTYGRRADCSLWANYRIGNGRLGNVGAEAIYHIASTIPGLLCARNPLPAAGGIDPEPLEKVRLLAPQHFHAQERAVNLEDYVACAQRFPSVRQVRARRRLTGSFHTIELTVLRYAGLAVDADFCSRLLLHLERFRMAGHVLRIVAPVKIPLDLRLSIGVQPGHFRSDVLVALSAALGPGSASKPGFFHPDRQSLGQPVFLSQLIRAAMQVQGVQWVEAIRFRRYGDPQARDTEVIELRPCEVASVENLATAKERGFLELVIGGRP